MFLNFLDRQATPTLLYLLLLLLIQNLPVPPNLLTPFHLLLTLYYLSTLLTALQTERRIALLGARAPTRWSRTPWNIGMVYDAIQHVRGHSNLEFWQGMFRQYGRGERPFTVEAITAGRRVVLTADEENVKAILATQFGEFGKGPQVRNCFFFSRSWSFREIRWAL